MILLGPGSTVSHDALRLMARHGTALVAVGEDGVRCYTAPPLMPDTSDTARRQMRAWGDPQSRLNIARKMYAIRLGEVLPQQDLNALRGVEGARLRRSYALIAERYGIDWRNRRYDRADPLWADLPNQAINHASVAVTSAAVVAVTAIGAIPQLGFIHEQSGEAFALDIADLFRVNILLPAAFQSAREVMDRPNLNIERRTRRNTGEMLRKERVIPKMIDYVKALFQDVSPLESGDRRPIPGPPGPGEPLPRRVPRRGKMPGRRASHDSHRNHQRRGSLSGLSGLGHVGNCARSLHLAQYDQRHQRPHLAGAQPVAQPVRSGFHRHDLA